MEADVFGPLMGVSSLDRMGLAREPGQVLDYLGSAKARCLVVGTQCVEVDDTSDSQCLRWRDVSDVLDLAHVFTSPAGADGDLASRLQDFVFLGQSDGYYRFAYRTVLTADNSAPQAPPAGGAVAGNQPTLVRLRSVLGDLPPGEAELAAIATAMTHWHLNHQYCGVCGTPTSPAKGGWERVCPACSTAHYPRTDCAVIMSVIDSDDRLLLARNVGWPVDRMSTLAGFLEPAETLENAVRREVFEETGIAVGDVEYVGSQGWPFPGQVMTAFTARAQSTEITVAEDEIDVAQWFTRDQYRQAVVNGQLRAANRTAMSGMLISRWLDGESLTSS